MLGGRYKCNSCRSSSKKSMSGAPAATMKSISRKPWIYWQAVSTTAEGAIHVYSLLAGALKGYEKMVTSRISIEDTKQKGFEELVNNKDDQVKILISPKLKAGQ
jgi:hypothetical protein